MARSAIMNVMAQAALKAGRGLARDFGEEQNLQVSRKGPADYASRADQKSADIIRAELAKARPDYGLLLGKTGEIIGSDSQHRFIADSLNGAANFLHGIPHFAVSIGLESQGRMAAAVIYNPAADELYTAERGDGAFLNDRRLRVSARRHLADCVIGTGIPHLGAKRHGAYLVELRNIMGEAAGIRRFGAAALALAYVAAGRLDGFWEDNLQPWDMAAGILLAREAGGFVSDKEGGAAIFAGKNIVAGNEYIHAALLKALKKPI